MFFIVVALCLVGTAFAQVPGNDRCPDVKVDPNFDLSKVNLIGKLFNFNSLEKFILLYLEFLTSKMQKHTTAEIQYNCRNADFF